ncbi:MAG: hypothetical protein WCO44_13620 [Bacteroidota bacterium]
MAALMISSAAACFGQVQDPWSKWSWLMGEWRGEGSGVPGQGGGTFSFNADLGGKVLVRKSHSEYPARDKKGMTLHDDLMIIYPGAAGDPLKAIYFDNEGHTISYSVAPAGNSIVFLSNKVAGMPVFRLTYDSIAAGTVNTKFEMSQDGEHFTTYIEGKSNIISR